MREGETGSALEVHEKLSSRSGNGAVALFSSTAGTYRYVTKSKPDQRLWHTDSVAATFDREGHAVIEVSFREPSAWVILFGVDV
ncbi:hypothetical protein [Paenibacillus nasutitermitis]|uniref:Uncharacterized protein n=1 Tax=Paenibacillus nasutitermitis TaxID=1652958 RepID=A0A916YUV8_9BACL|nr:hypothetical protein [Paenibacillus nasutitermitis]GGD62273.1 hypothetical protein GCM10010911_20200 [Paenibacillus nasutitermitis]